MCLLDTGQRGDAIAENSAIGFHVRDTKLDQVVEAARHHVALLHLAEPGHGLLETVEDVGGGPVQADFDERQQMRAELVRVEVRRIAADVAEPFQATHALDARRGTQVDAPRQFGEGNPPVVLEDLENPVVQAIHLD